MKIVFSLHAQQRVKERSFTFPEISDVILNGRIESKEKHKLKMIKGDVVVVIANEKNRVVVLTCYYTDTYTRRVNKFAREHKIGYKKALKGLKNKSLSFS